MPTSTKKARGNRVSQKKLLDEINLWAPRLGLDANWHIIVEFSETNKQHETTFAPYKEGYREARITLSLPEMRDRNRRGQILDIIHELRHLHYEPIRGTLYEFMGGGKIFNALHKEIETLCDYDAMYFYRLFSRRKKAVS